MSSASSPAPKRPLRTQVLTNTIVVIGGRAISIGFSAVATSLLARYLGSEELGEFSAVFAYLSLFAWFSTFGMESILVREASRDRESAGSIVRTGVMLMALLCVASVTLALFIAPHAGYRDRLLVLVAIACIETLIAPLRLPGLVFQVDLRQWYGVGINVIRQGLWLALIIALREYHAPLTYVVGARVAVATVEALLIWSASRRFFSASATVLWRQAPHYLKESFPVAISTLLAGVYLRIDQVMLHNMVNDRVLGQYAAAVKVRELLETAPSALLYSMAPILSVAAGIQFQFQAYQSRTFRYLNVCAAGLCVVITVGAPLIIKGLYGPKFSAAVLLLQILIWSEISIFFSAVVMNILVARNQQRYLAIPTAAGAIVNVLLNLYLIPRYAAVGAAIATVVSYTVGWMVILLFFRETRSTICDGWKTVLPALLVAGCAIGVAVLLPYGDGLRSLVAVFTFAAGVVLSRLVHREDVAFAWSALAGMFPKAKQDPGSFLP
jgi:PST family polysaccharide transporter